VVADISERKQFQEAVDANVKDLVALNTKLEDAHLQLLQSEKMASIGQLAAGVAHEINNPVGFVFSNLGSLDKYLVDIFSLLDAYQVAEAALDTTTQDRMHALRQELDIDFLRQDIAALMGETREGINRVRKIVQDLKDFSRVGSEDDWQWLDVHAGLESTLSIVWNELKYKTTVDKQYGQLPQIYGLPSQLNQVFMNLLVNAAHAIDTKGVVTIRTGQQDAEVWIEVEDTGCGIPAENLKRIFDPFFTTKPVGKGTGLGLSVSYSIVQKHHGRIEIRSEVGKGTAFRVCLPINPPEPADNAVPATGHFIPPAPTLEHS
jgi:signal transduction histidine kinase